MRGVAGGKFLLDLKKQRVPDAVSEKQDDIIAGAHAARADDLKRHVQGMILVEDQLPGPR